MCVHIFLEYTALSIWTSTCCTCMFEHTTCDCVRV